MDDSPDALCKGAPPLPDFNFGMYTEYMRDGYNKFCKKKKEGTMLYPDRWVDRFLEIANGTMKGYGE